MFGWLFGDKSNAVHTYNRTHISLQIGGFFFALANIICVAILAYTYLSVKLEPKTITVKGSAKKAIQSDLISWTGTLVAENADLVKAYEKLKADADRVAEFLKEKGVKEKEITFSSVSTERVYEREIVPQPAKIVDGKLEAQEPRVLPSKRIEKYVLHQSVTIESGDMKIVPEVSRSVTSLIQAGVEIDSGSPNYLYTKLSELKLDMLAEASKDAATRAEQVVKNAHGKLGRLVEAQMGIMQINPKGSTATSAEGNNDTTSFEKEITSVVTARFELK